jgi:hypothetical protein
MNLFIYTDELGVFDHINNDFFVFGGLIFQSKSKRDIETRKYLSVEKSIRRRCGLRSELKACALSNKHKGQLFRSMNAVVKFVVFINQKMIHERIFDHKKSKQRYLDYAYKIGLKRALLELDSRGSICSTR